MDLEDPQAADLRSVLAELSRTRARRGFTATETAVGVFALKDALLGLLDHGDPAALRDFVSQSTPVVKLGEGVVAVPLVGTLDSARAQVVMERLLQMLVDTGSPYAIAAAVLREAGLRRDDACVSRRGSNHDR